MSSVALESTPLNIEVDHLGLIAGEGDFPVLIARAARSQAIPVTVFGLKGSASPRLEEEAETVHWLKISEFDEVVRLCHKEGISKAVMAGRIRHSAIFQPGNFKMANLVKLAKLANKKADSLLGLVTRELEKENITVLDQTLFVRSCMPGKGLLTPLCPPTDDMIRDIEFGLDLAKKTAGLDIGQTVVVKSQSIVAIEAMEGTDATIERAGRIAGPGTVVVKVAKPQQDKRFDVPVIGLTTLEKMVRAQSATLAFPANEVLILSQSESVELAEANGICIISI